MHRFRRVALRPVYVYALVEQVRVVGVQLPLLVIEIIHINLLLLSWRELGVIDLLQYIALQTLLALPVRILPQRRRVSLLQISFLVLPVCSRPHLALLHRLTLRGLRVL